MEPRHRSALVEIIQQARRRWRVKLVLRASAAALIALIAAFLVSASGLQALRFSPPAILAFRLLIVAVAALAIWWALRPLRRRVTDEQVALYLEERDPTLQTALLSAVEATREGDGARTSPALVDRLVEQAIERCRALHEDRNIEWAATRRHAAAIGVALAAALAVISLGPPYLRQALSAMLIVSRSAEAASPYRIDVKPGNITIPRGSDQAIAATLSGFSAHDADVLVRKAGAKAFERVPLVPGAAPQAFEGMLFHVDAAADYYVEADGVKSPVYAMQVVDLPAVSRLEIEYRFPAYTGLPPQKIDTGGDVAALRGTDVQLRIIPSMATPGGRIVMSDGDPRPLAPQTDGSLTGSFRIDRPGFYHVELDGPHGEHVNASPRYTIDVVDDRAPTVSFTKPGRDTNASPVEELFVEARAEDDFGIKSLQLVYSVNGGAEKTVTLFGGSKTLTEVSAGHTVYLEELGLQPGDFVSYYARATDNDATAGGKTATSDIYFTQIRPFRKDYKPAQSAAGMGGGGGGEVGALSQQQRQIVAATFNSVRDRAKTKPEKYRENVVFLTLAQSKLRDQVQELVDKLNSRLGGGGAQGFSKIAQALPKAIDEMKSAEQDLRAQNAKNALAPEQRALKLLQDAEQEYETQVAANRGGGGSMGEDDSLADDLADLFDLEMDKLANQYETEQRSADQAAGKQMNELLERLKELARRQQQEAERQRRMAQAGRAGSGSGGGQRSLADQAEEMARRLEELRRDAPRPELADAAKRLQEAADAMRRAAANGSGDGGAQAAAALEQLKEAERRLQQTQAGHAREGVQSALQQAQALANEEKDVQSEVQALQQPGGSQGDRAARLAQRKDAMASRVGDLEQQLQKLADQTRGDQRDASRKLQEAAGGIHDNKVKEKINYSKGVLSRPEYAKAFEQEIGANLDELQSKVGQAAAAMGEASKDAALGKALDQARDLVRGMESMSERMRQGATGRAGRAGEAGREDATGISSRPATGASGGDARPPAGFAGGDWRQFRRELREREADAEALRRTLGQAGVNAREFDDVLRQLHALDDDRAYSDPKGLQELHAAALERLKKFDFDLRRRAGSDGQPPALSSSDEVPPSFRQAVEEYYRALARRKQ